MPNKQPKYRTIEEYPIMLTANELMEILRISRSNAYLVMKMKGFPTLRIGDRMVVSRDRLIAWINTQLDGGTDEEGGQMK